jgi:hypothetical protein
MLTITLSTLTLLTYPYPPPSDPHPRLKCEHRFGRKYAFGLELCDVRGCGRVRAREFVESALPGEQVSRKARVAATAPSPQRTCASASVRAGSVKRRRGGREHALYRCAKQRADHTLRGRFDCAEGAVEETIDRSEPLCTSAFTARRTHALTPHQRSRPRRRFCCPSAASTATSARCRPRASRAPSAPST